MEEPERGYEGNPIKKVIMNGNKSDGGITAVNKEKDSNNISI